jgi:microcystin-dependent protein
MKKIKILLTFLVIGLGVSKGYSQYSYVGQIKIFAGNFPPAGWAFCSGQLLPISEYETLFTIIGTTYGGDGETTFALPDLRGRLVTGATGKGIGLNNVALGQMYGTETNTMTVSQMPAHNHSVSCVSVSGDQNLPTGNLFANAGTLDKEYANSAPNTTMNVLMVNQTGGNQPFDNMQPTLGLNFIISLYGIYPSPN